MCAGFKKKRKERGKTEINVNKTAPIWLFACTVASTFNQPLFSAMLRITPHMLSRLQRRTNPAG